MLIRSTSQLLLFDLKIKRTLFKSRKAKEDNIRTEDQHSDRYIEGNSDQNEMRGM